MPTNKQALPKIGSKDWDWTIILGVITLTRKSPKSRLRIADYGIYHEIFNVKDNRTVAGIYGKLSQAKRIAELLTRDDPQQYAEG